MDTMQKIKLSDVKNVFEDKSVIIIDDTIYDVTSFKNDHPGGRDVLEEYLYKDATNAFNDIGHSENAKSTMMQYIVGIIDRSDTGIIDNASVDAKPEVIPDPSPDNNDNKESDSKNKPCSDFAKNCEQIKNNTLLILTGLFGLFILFVVYLITQDPTASLITTYVIVAAILYVLNSSLVSVLNNNDNN